MSTKLRIDVYQNNGKKSNGKRIVLDMTDNWVKCMQIICDKLKFQYNPNCKLYSKDGLLIQSLNSVIDGESLFFDEKGDKYVPIDGPKSQTDNNISASLNILNQDQSIFKYSFKFIIIGSSGVGKSCCLLQFTEKRFRSTFGATIGVDFGKTVANVQGVPIKFQIWDTAGQEEFNGISRLYYREAAGAIIMYDITDRMSFKKVSTWLDNIKKFTTNDNISITLAGNKTDLPNRSISRSEGQDFADKNHMDFFETSTKTGSNVDMVFIKTAERIIEKINNGTINPNKKEAGVIFNNDYELVSNSKNSDTFPNNNPKSSSNIKTGALLMNNNNNNNKTNNKNITGQEIATEAIIKSSQPFVKPNMTASAHDKTNIISNSNGTNYSTLKTCNNGTIKVGPSKQKESDPCC